MRAMQETGSRNSLWWLPAGLLLVALTLASLAVGYVDMKPLRLLRGALAGEWVPSRILWDLRVPRTVLCVAVGAALGMSGAALQGLLRNPLAEHGIVPAYQGLETDDPTLRHIHLGLIAQAELPPTNGLGQKLLEGQLAMQALLHAGGEALPAKPPHLLGLVHGHVGTGDEVVAVIRVVRVDGDADAAADSDLGDTAQLQWLAHLGEHEIRHLLGPIARHY